ncbi:hypothetical protein LLEC1_05270, partial [Akanthomyces lecanii]
LLLTSQAVFVCGIYMAKFAVLLATERLLAASMKTVRRICILIRATLGAAALASILLITVNCPTQGLLSPQAERQCSGLGQRWVIISILDGVTELAILCVFYGLVWSLQMRLARKWMLTVLLGLRILCPVFTGIYTSAIKSYSTSASPEVQVMSPLVWQQVALGYSLIAALLIALIPFLRSFHTGMSMNNLSKTNGSRLGGSRVGSSRPRSVPLSETEVTRSASRSRDALAASWRKSRSEDGGSTDEPQQQQQGPDPLVIQKTVDWSVQYEEGEAGGLQHPGLPGYLHQQN